MITKIATIGDHRTFIDLALVSEGRRLELVSTMHCKGLSVELARELVISEDDAIDLATDMEWAAQDELVAMDIDYSKTAGFPEALERHFAQARLSIAAE